MSSLADQFLDDVGSDSDTPDTPDTHDPRDPRDPRDSPPSQPPSHTHSDPVPYPSHLPPTLSKKLTDLLSGIQTLSSSPISTSDAVEYNLVISCTHIISEIDDEILILYRKLKEAYAPGFPELETLIFNPLDYARVARLSANEADLAQVDLRRVLPSATVITVQVTASSSAGRKLNEEELNKVYGLCDAMMELDEVRGRILEHVESRAGYMAPNLVEVVGGAVAAKLMGLAGGLTELAGMPSCNVKVMGKVKKSLGGTSSATTRMHEGVIFTCPLVMGLPKKYRGKAGEVVSGKAVLAARVDACRTERMGNMGRTLKNALMGKFAKWQEAPPAKTAKPLPVPGEESKRRHRGGKRARKEKERMGLTDVRRLANRIKFGEQEEVVGNDMENDGFGMLGKEGSNRLRVQTKKTDSVSVGTKRRLAKQKKKEGASEAEMLGITGGGGNLSFTSVQGLELSATTPAPGGVGLGSMDGTRMDKDSTYFSASAPFLGVRKEKREISKTSKAN